MVKLKPFNWSNVETHFNWNNDPELSFYDSDFPHKNETIESFISRLRELNNHGNQHSKILEIICSETGELIGVIDILGIDKINKRCCLESTIGNKAYRNKGLGKMAMMQALEYCFNELSMNKVSTVSFDFNSCWIHLVKGMGFVEEGRMRKHVLKNEQYCDKIIFSMLREEYEESAKKHYNYADAI